MANTPDMATCSSPVEGRSGDLLPLSPFYSLNYHFGMLLGVDDFETEQAYHRAKMRLHNAWLHREGVIWGFDVRLDKDRGEIRVLPGLALDATGHELHLEGDACVNVGKWFEAHQHDAGFTPTIEADRARFNAHVVIRFKACLTRQVPALMEPCEGGGSDTAYSRVFETVEILLRPGKAPDRPVPLSHHLLRLLFGLDEPISDPGNSGKPIVADQQVLDERIRIMTLDRENQPAAYVQAFHRFAALDEIAMQPATSADGSWILLFPSNEDVPVVLANITDITIEKQTDGSWIVKGGNVDTSVRPSHVATTTIQDLLCRSFLSGKEMGSDAGGPRVDPVSVQVTGAKISFTVDKALDPASVTAQAFAITYFDATGWHAVTINDSDVALGPAATGVTITLNPAVGGGRIRFIARGTNETPLLGANFVPLAGAMADLPAKAHNGNDFVYMQAI